MILKSSVDRLLQVADIVEVISSYVDLRKTGSNYMACCPFHDERSASFSVNQAKGFYHCFGCGASGDSIQFVMEFEKLSFVEALEKLAHRFNVTLEYDKGVYYDYKEDYHLLEMVSSLYQEELFNAPFFLDYLQKRGLNIESIRAFKLGLCVNRIYHGIENKGLNKDKLIELGVLGKNDNNQKTYLRFLDRIMFPIYNPSAQVVGFGGRTLKEKGAKYINSPQSKLFDKSSLLYGYHLAKESIYKQKQVIVTEGYLDVILLHQAGFKNAIATLGTALTPSHLPLLKKGEPEIFLSYDGDKAGRNAAYKASLMLAKEQRKGGVILFENNLDPADMIANNQIETLKNWLSHPIAFIEFVLRHMASSYVLDDPLEKDKALKEMLGFLKNFSLLLQSEYKPLIATLLQVPSHVLGIKERSSFQPFYSKTEKSNYSQKFVHVSNTLSLEFLEKLVIRYLLEDRSLLDLAVGYIHSGVFLHKKQEFDALCQEKLDDPKLVALLLDANLPLKKGGFEKELRLLILRYFERQLKEIPKSPLSFSEKMIALKKVRQAIIKLKQGELVAI
ncbi:DNA primase [Helicobacter acinonychis]|uniref:DNA primase n=1 Tax=Helicobacter acinonychis (strain Sheeba) TaxID=382638 RepID=Q17VC8_HELAH|nr:DNA primase [Helicobacter acinonychis]CAK00398.1 DNA primase DnaG [Helicobacter acinonychis str. Sheeba]STP05081.1 DNA primase [Helicobacter acinonychis]